MTYLDTIGQQQRIIAALVHRLGGVVDLTADEINDAPPLDMDPAVPVLGQQRRQRCGHRLVAHPTQLFDTRNAA